MGIPLTARPVTDPAEIARRLVGVNGTDAALGVKRKYTLHALTGVWVGWRAGNPGADELIGDFRFVYADSDGFFCSQIMSHEFVSSYPSYLPDGDHPSTVEQWWLGEALKLKVQQ